MRRLQNNNEKSQQPPNNGQVSASKMFSFLCSITHLARLIKSVLLCFRIQMVHLQRLTDTNK